MTSLITTQYNFDFIFYILRYMQDYRGTNLHKLILNLSNFQKISTPSIFKTIVLPLSVITYPLNLKRKESPTSENTNSQNNIECFNLVLTIRTFK